jgi:hypothetical protein
MAFDLAAWVMILGAGWTIGRGFFVALRPHHARPGDRCLLSAWIGVIVLAVTLLGTSLVAPITPLTAAAVATPLVALGTVTIVREHRRVGARPVEPDARIPARALLIGGALLFVGSAALASDPVTLYDSLVYHVGLIQWLRQHGTVPGVALIHTRLGHVSAWFALAAPFDAGPAASRSANVPLGVALILVGLQIAITAARIAARRASVPDWFLAVISVALAWAAATHAAATPSPDVAANTLIVAAAWSILVVSDGAPSKRVAIVPFVIALGACAMKLFAVPAAVGAGLYALTAQGNRREQPGSVRRAILLVGVAVALLGPFVVANLVASGCPAFPSPIGCLDTPWSVGAARATDYSSYVRDVARWERRGVTSVGGSLGWVAPWMLAHPLITLLAISSPVLAIWLSRRAVAASPGDRALDPAAARAVATISLVGIAFASWFAPAPRFLFAFVLILPCLALAMWLHSHVSVSLVDRKQVARRTGIAFVGASAVIAFTYTLASQKLNIRSAVARGAALAPVTLTDLLVPRAPEVPPRLFRWRVNDVDVITPVPRPVADTLGYHSEIPLDASFEKCSAAPLPCTPYLPSDDVALRKPGRGLSGGFVRAEHPGFTRRVATCVGELSYPEPSAPPTLKPSEGSVTSRCGEAR